MVEGIEHLPPKLDRIPFKNPVLVEASICVLYGGPLMMFLPVSPNVPGGFAVKALLGVAWLGTTKTTCCLLRHNAPAGGPP